MKLAIKVAHDAPGLEPAKQRGFTAPSRLEPWQMSFEDYVLESTYRMRLHRTYYDEHENKTVPSSRVWKQNASLYDFALGTWMLEDDPTHKRNTPSPWGLRLFQLQEVQFESLVYTEDKVPTNEGGRGEDAERYAEWIRQGSPPPPIKCFETPEGIEVFDGHRRAYACHLANAPIRAWVNPLTVVTVNGKNEKVGLTAELAIREAIETGKLVHPRVLRQFGFVPMAKARRGEERPGHKWKSRKGTPGRWRYTYEGKEYALIKKKVPGTTLTQYHTHDGKFVIAPAVNYQEDDIWIINSTTRRLPKEFRSFEQAKAFLENVVYKNLSRWSGEEEKKKQEEVNTASDLLEKYLKIKAQPFLSPDDMNEIKAMLPDMHRAGIDISSLNIGEYKKDPTTYILQFRLSRMKNPTRVTQFNERAWMKKSRSHKYLRRLGGPGNYRYVYKEGELHARPTTTESTPEKDKKQVTITHEQAQKLVDSLNKEAEGKCEFEIIGSLSKPGAVSHHDIDLEITILDEDWEEDYMEGLEDEYAVPVYAPFMRKVGAELRKVSDHYAYDDYHDNPDEWKIGGVIVDVFRESVQKSLRTRLAMLIKGRGFHKYIRRLGARGNYRYIYQQEKKGSPRLAIRTEVDQPTLPNEVISEMAAAEPGTFKNWNGVIWRKRDNGKWRQATKAERELYWEQQRAKGPEGAPEPAQPPQTLPPGRKKKVLKHEPTTEKKLMISFATFRKTMRKFAKEQRFGYTKEQVFEKAFGRALNGEQDEERLQALIQEAGFGDFLSYQIALGIPNSRNRVRDRIHDDYNRVIGSRYINGKIVYHDPDYKKRVDEELEKLGPIILTDEQKSNLGDLLASFVIIPDVGASFIGTHLEQTGEARPIHEIPDDLELKGFSAKMKAAMTDVNTYVEFFIKKHKIAGKLDFSVPLSKEVITAAIKILYKVKKEIGYDRLFYVTSYRNDNKTTSFARANAYRVDIGSRCSSSHYVYTELVNSRGVSESHVQNIKALMLEKIKSLPEEQHHVREEAIKTHIEELLAKKGKAFFGNYISKVDPMGSVIVHELGHTILYQKNEPRVWKRFFAECRRTGLTKMVSEYANTSHQEFFAESLAMYMYDRELLHPKIKAEVEKILKVKKKEEK